LFLANLLSLPCLLVRKTRGIESLVDYRQSHIIIYKEYANIYKIKPWTKKLLKKLENKKGKKRIIKE
jgi:hypothetical protein